MGFGSSIKGFDWDNFGFLLDADFEGAGNSVLTFLIDYSWEIAFLIGMIALGYSIIQMIAAQNVNIPVILFRIALTITLISYYEPMCEKLINFADEVAYTLSYNTKIDMNRAFLDVADARKDEAEDYYQRIYGNDDLSEEDKQDILESAGFYNPYKLSLINFNPLKLIASLLLILCQVAILLIEKFRNVILAILLLIGRICVVGIAWEKTEGFTKGWFLSFINALSWTILLAVIINLQQYTGLRTVFADNATNDQMVNGIANCIVFLFMYLQVFGMGKELMAGSLGASAASIGTGVATGIVGKYMAKGAFAGTKKLGKGIYDKYRDMHHAGLFGSGGGLTQMDSSVSPVRINDSLPSLPAPEARQIGGDSYTALPSPPQTDFYGGDDGIASSSNYTMDNMSHYNPNDDGGPIIDAEYTIKND